MNWNCLEAEEEGQSAGAHCVTGNKAEQRPTTVELQLVVEIVQLLLDVRGTRTVVTGAERQQHVDLKYEKTAFWVFL